MCKPCSSATLPLNLPIPTYPNYALFGTLLEKMYGDNLERLREIRKMYNPQYIMGLVGGWKF
jgi:hypothetical protein